MSEALIAASASPQAAIPIHAVTADGLSAWLALPESQGRRSWIESNGFKAGAGRWLGLPASDGSLAAVLVGLGRGPDEQHWAAGGLARELPTGTYALADSPALDADTRRWFALAWALGAYRFGRYRAEGARELARLLIPDGVGGPALERLVDSTCRLRDLINTPAADMGPAEVAEAALAVARRFGAKARVIAGDDLLRENYPTIHAVGRASARAPRLVDLRWGDPSHPRLTLLGKGVCFDTGGLDLKPSSAMRLMKKDMGGAAHALALAELVMGAGLKVALRVLVPTVENAVSGNAMRPLDVIRTRAGITVEIDNTDAEGRLILCDALAEAVTEDTALIIDFATLTGAARTALGPDMPALFSTSQDLTDALLRHAEAESDPLWPLPLWKPYRRLLDSKTADIANSSELPMAGAITAALFLKEFIPDERPWLHIDLYAWNRSTRPGRPEGGEAQTLRALFALLAERFPA